MPDVGNRISDLSNDRDRYQTLIGIEFVLKTLINVRLGYHSDILPMRTRAVKLQCGEPTSQSEVM